MSVPLDRLYNFLNSLCNRDTLIYHFFPHGSKKHSNLQLLDSGPVSISTWLTTPIVLMHDQEPLDWKLFTNQEYIEEFPESAELKVELVNANIRPKFCHLANCYDYTILCHSEKNSPQLAQYESNWFVGVYYWAHALIARDWYRFAQHDPVLEVTNIENDFLIYNRAWTGSREYRLLFAELVADAALVNCCNIKFSEYDAEQHYVNHKFKNPTLAIKRTDLQIVYPPNYSNSDASADYNNKDYSTAAVEVVLETLFDDQRQHLTEKTLRPIACGRPFMLAATAGSLQYLRDYGFETFDGFIDESYDTITDPKLRLEAIVKEMSRISQLDSHTKQELWKSLYEIANRNKKLFFSAEWHNNIVQEYKDNMNRAFSKLDLDITRVHWQKLKSIKNHSIHPSPQPYDEIVAKVEAWYESVFHDHAIPANRNT